MHFKYLNHYPDPVQQQVRLLIEQGRTNSYLNGKYPEKHMIQTDKALYHYVSDLKKQYLKNAAQVDKVQFDNTLDITHRALGLNTAISRVQGGKLQAKKEIRVASLFKNAPLAFLNMIVVHELAHLKERNHDKAFYKLCMHMLPNYHQIEFDTRIYLTCLDLDLIDKA